MIITIFLKYFAANVVILTRLVAQWKPSTNISEKTLIYDLGFSEHIFTAAFAVVLQLDHYYTIGRKIFLTESIHLEQFLLVKRFLPRERCFGLAQLTSSVSFNSFSQKWVEYSKEYHIRSTSSLRGVEEFLGLKQSAHMRTEEEPNKGTIC